MNTEQKQAKAQYKAMRPWYRKKRFWLLGLVALIVIIAVASNIGGSDPALKPPPAAHTSAPAIQEGPDVSKAQQNAVRKADQYLQTFPFSRQGLINQLSSQTDGFSVPDATYAVDHVKVDWNAQAAKKAKSYLDTMPFSRTALLNQLAFDGFTMDQAEYGVRQNGL